jgi:hypothetical protein
MQCFWYLTKDVVRNGGQVTSQRDQSVRKTWGNPCFRQWHGDCNGPSNDSGRVVSEIASSESERLLEEVRIAFSFI